MNGNWLVLVALVLSTAIYSVGSDELAYLGELLLANVLFRHGARTSIVRHMNDPITERQWGNKTGELTQLGMKEAMELGLYLRHRYASFLPEVYNTDDVLVRSSDVDRTIVSGMMVMNGIFPLHKTLVDLRSVNWQVTPVHTMPAENNFLIPPVSPPCPAFQAELDKVTNSREFQSFESQMTYIKNFSNAVSGLPPGLLFDVWNSKSYHGLPVPFWSREVFPEPLHTYFAWSLFFMYGSTAPIRRMCVGKMAQDMLDHMRMKIEGTLKPDRKLFVYSGHDTNVIALLSALDVWNGKLPPFSSCVMVELRLDNRGQHIVTVSYKNDTSQPPHLLHLPGCRTAACSFQEFFAVLAPEVFDEAECYGGTYVSWQQVP